MAPDADRTAPSAWALLRPYVLDVFGPFLAYALVSAFGVKAFWALAGAGVVAGASTLFNSIRAKGLDAVGGLVLLELLASLSLLFFVQDGRWLLARPSFYTALAAVYLAGSAFAGHPLSYAGSRPMAARGGPARIAAYERAWERSPEFRRTHTGLTLGIACGLLVDATARVLIVWRYPLERSAWLSNVPHLLAMLLILASSALAGRRFDRLVDEYM